MNATTPPTGDIVTRIVATACTLPRWDRLLIRDLMYEAADEIQRLRAANYELSQSSTEGHGYEAPRK